MLTMNRIGWLLWIGLLLGVLSKAFWGDLHAQPASAWGPGLSIYRSLDLDETEEEVKSSQGFLYGVWFSNGSGATRYLKCYDGTAAAVVVGTTTPVMTLALPGNADDAVAGSLTTGSPSGIGFATAITCAVTTGVADNDTGAPGANDVQANFFYR